MIIYSFAVQISPDSGIIELRIACLLCLCMIFAPIAEHCYYLTWINISPAGR